MAYWTVPVCIVTALVDGAARPLAAPRLGVPPPQTVPVCIVTALKNRQHAIV
ncbi:hypothetical protein [Mycobacterium sp.]|uniref:hypothetical protein n=1 Tax=Mycobacterium sp. TaxID=1785 RepID=UPI003F9D9B66